jgi:hypothetical protein
VAAVVVVVKTLLVEMVFQAEFHLHMPAHQAMYLWPQQMVIAQFLELAVQQQIQLAQQMVIAQLLAHLLILNQQV